MVVSLQHFGQNLEIRRGMSELMKRKQRRRESKGGKEARLVRESIPWMILESKEGKKQKGSLRSREDQG